MTDESNNMSANSRARAAESINKVGFMDGAADGQKATFQSSFDSGYSQGFSFGMELGIKEAYHNFQNTVFPNDLQPRDPRKINCQICIHSAVGQDDIVNLFNLQKESNDLYRIQNLQVVDSLRSFPFPRPFP